jgi:hypothetical protein
MTEIIQCISEVTDVKCEDHYSAFDGYKISTDKRSIFVVIGNDQDCCEVFGYFYDNKEDFSYYKGAELLDVLIIDEEMMSESMMRQDLSLRSEYREESFAYFVEVKTSKGSFQLAVYNEHNGYYGHNVRVFDSNNTILLEAVA